LIRACGVPVSQGTYQILGMDRLAVIENGFAGRGFCCPHDIRMA
jgi:hypothetical protein